jgi:CTP:molybdopterin cytidylyltransferase MocA
MDAQAYLLAAGRGRRAGGPKAWRLFEGKTLLERQLEFLKSFIASERIAVSIQEEWLDRCRQLDARVHWIAVNPDAPALTSILALCAALPLRRRTFIHHVDMRVWKPELFAALIHEVGGDEAALPVYEGRRGHPVLLSQKLHSALAGLDASQDRLDVWLRGRRVREVAVPFACAVDNWNS